MVQETWWSSWHFSQWDCGWKGSAGEQQSWHLLIQPQSMAGWRLVFPTCTPDSFLDRYLCGKNNTHRAALRKYSWSQSCLLKWIDRCSLVMLLVLIKSWHNWEVMWNCSYVVLGSLLHIAPELLCHRCTSEERICWADAVRANKPGSRVPQFLPTLDLEKLAWKDIKKCICAFLCQYIPNIYGDSGTIRL